MFFHVRDLEIRPKQFDVEIPAGEIDLLDPKLAQVGPLQAAGKVELVLGSLGEIRATGHLSARVEAECDRCLDKSVFPVDADFELFYWPVEEGYGEEKSLDESEAEMGFYEGDGLELNDVLREFMLLSLPMQRICKEDCKGLCPVCGQSRNQSECQCANERVDDRWAALKSLK